MLVLCRYLLYCISKGVKTKKIFKYFLSTFSLRVIESQIIELTGMEDQLLYKTTDVQLYSANLREISKKNINKVEGIL